MSFLSSGLKTICPCYFSRYAAEYLPNIKYVVKSDDDVAVDTFHLERYLEAYVPEKGRGEAFFLCDPVQGNVPHR